MPSSSRITDLGAGICTCHVLPPVIPMTGALTMGSGDVMDTGHGVSRVTDVILGFCGHIGIMTSGSGTVYANGLQQVRIGDPFVGCFIGSLISGEGTVLVG